MFTNIDEILKINAFQADGTYIINGCTLAEIKMRIEEQNYQLMTQQEIIYFLMKKEVASVKEKHQKEFQEIEEAINDYYDKERYKK